MNWKVNFYDLRQVCLPVIGEFLGGEIFIVVINFIVQHFLLDRFLSFLNDKYFQPENGLEKTLKIEGKEP